MNSSPRRGLTLIALAVAMPAILVGPSLAIVAAGDKAPDFQLGSVDGQATLHLSDYTTKPTLLVFWASWCPHCQREVPILQSLTDELKPKGMNAIGVSADENIGDARDFVKKYAVTFPNGFAGTQSSQKVLDSFDVTSVPTIYVLDTGGVVKAHHQGEIPAQTIRDEFAQIGVK
jgi:peroxiredoxin